MNSKRNAAIVSAVRTPLGSFNGVFSTVPATKLGSLAIAEALKRIDLSADRVDEVYMGCVLAAGLGQAPARQASLGAGIPNSVGATTVNKVCGSSLKTVIMAAQSPWVIRSARQGRASSPPCSMPWRHAGSAVESPASASVAARAWRSSLKDREV